MAKEQLHSWGKTFLILAGVVFAGGGWSQLTKSNSAGIKVNASDIKAHEDKVDKVIEDVHQIELDAKDIKNVAVKAAEAYLSIDTKLDAIQTEQTKQAMVQAVNSEKLKTLTKD